MITLNFNKKPFKNIFALNSFKPKRFVETDELKQYLIDEVQEYLFDVDADYAVTGDWTFSGTNSFSGTNTFTSVVKFNNKVYFETDKNTFIQSPTDNAIGFYFNNALDFTMGINYFQAEAGSNIKTDTLNETTAGAGVTVDGLLIKDGGATANSTFAGFFPKTAAQSLSGAGAVSVSAYHTQFTSTGVADALTIASGSQIGQRKKITHIVDGGSGVLTGVFVGGTTITFTTVGEFADLLWDGASWAVLELGNTATPGTLPVLA